MLARSRYRCSELQSLLSGMGYLRVAFLDDGL
jgi:hypothetical protein